jgi:elongation factor P--(R)-beta-lysine ligase
MTTAPSPWWAPARHTDRRLFLMARNRIKTAIRNWFESQGFVEVETGCLQISPGNETHLHAFKTESIGTDLARRTLYLHTSPEFACKKLLAAGEEKIFTFAPVFRNRESGPLHAAEFTMLEWYRAGADYETVMDDAASILKLAADVTSVASMQWRGTSADPYQTPERLTVDAAFQRHTGFPLPPSANDPSATVAFRSLAAAKGIATSNRDTWSDLFSKVLAAHVEPHLGSPRATLLYDYPVSEAALARPKPSDSSVAERFELYCCGVELANGFGELTNAQEQRRRFEADMALKQEIYGERYPIDDDFLAALAQMPPASGCALGFDRLVMLATGATHINQVQWTPRV